MLAYFLSLSLKAILLEFKKKNLRTGKLQIPAAVRREMTRGREKGMPFKPTCSAVEVSHVMDKQYR